MLRIRQRLGFIRSTPPENRGTSSIARQPIGNCNVIPNTFSTTDARFRTYAKKRKVALNANWSSIELTYVNFTDNSVSEGSGYPDLVLKASIKYGGTFYPVSFPNNGVLSAGGTITGTVAGLTLPAGAEFEERVRCAYPLQFKTQTVNFTVGETVTGGTSGATGVIVAQTDAGDTGKLTLINETGTFVDGEALTGSLGGAAVVDLVTTQSVITGIGAQACFNEGVSSTADSTIDYTSTDPCVLPVYTANLSGGNITSVTRVSGGSGWSSAPSMYAYEMQSNGTLAVKNIGYGNLSAGAVNSGTVTSGAPPAGATWTNPTIAMAGGTSFGSSTAIICAALISGIPDRRVCSLLLVGDSIGRGYTSADTVGDIYHNYGVYERAIENRFGVINISTSGGKASYYVQYASIYPKMFAFAMGKTTHALITLGTNDFQAGDSKATVLNNNNTIANYIRTFGTKVSMAYVIMRTTSTDSFATVVNQTPLSGFETGGKVDQYNSDINNNVIVSNWGIPNLRPVYADSVSLDKWRVNEAITTDGTHPNLLGIGRGATDATFKAYFNILS